MKIPSFEIIGSREKAVAIVEIPTELEEEKEKIAEKILEQHKNVKTVLRKISKRKGEFREREFELLAGDPNTEVIQKEYSYLLKVDPQKVYFSPREATERQRIASSVKSSETIMLMFAGIGAMAVAIAKKQDVRKIFAVEKNPAAANYLKENIRINKLAHKIVPLQGDVRIVCREFFDKCDRVIMPLPLQAKEFLELAVSCLKKRGIINYYTVSDANATEAEKELQVLKKITKKYTIMQKQIVLPYSPKKFKVRLDILVEK
jgi:tRNA (guanine37-N1)-methyltransferase